MIAAILVAAALAPAGYQGADLVLRFERDGYRGGVYLNADHSYLIVQTGADGHTVGFTGRWRPNGSTGFCLEPELAGAGKCFDQMPTRIGRPRTVTSDHAETYRVELRRSR